MAHNNQFNNFNDKKSIKTFNNPIQGHTYGYSIPEVNKKQPCKTQPKSEFVLGGFLVSISDFFDYIDSSSQSLTSYGYLNLELAFKTIATSCDYYRSSDSNFNPKLIRNQEMVKFLNSQKFQPHSLAISLLIQLFDSAGNQGIDYEDFESLISRKSQKNMNKNQLDSAYSQGQDFNETELNTQQKYTLARYFYNLSRQLISLVKNSEFKHLHHVCRLDKISLFDIAKYFKTRNTVKFDGLKTFLSNNQIYLADDKLVNILRTIDIDCVGEINFQV